MELLLALLLGVGLAAACGFRVFVPLLVASVAAGAGHLTLTPDFAWLGSDAALMVLLIATVLEVAAFHVPWLDNLLDTLAVPAAVVAGTVITGAFVDDVSPLLRWSLAVIAGGGAAGAVAGGMAVVRGASTALTGGLGNPLVAFVETVASVLVAALAVVAPLLAVALVVAGLVFAVRRVRGLQVVA